MARALRLGTLNDYERLCKAFLAMVLAIMLLFFAVELFQDEAIGEASLFLSKENCSTASPRKLLQSTDNGEGNRMGTECSKADIAIFQGTTAPLPSGIPSYTVQILNVCVSGCSISDIHVSCGWFSSARLINPRVFRRLYYDDCLVNDGEALGPGETLSFQYSNSFRYPLSVSSVACCY
ncbi:hypothetical protein SLEP1_g29123 [Rubroshorea leprosula]|uniref:Uncharacterized protein n=1 Tax=Rubroshorea leprosula TaxID=152421 RepID=A0AAV5K1K8_9ROSI|nr:hypothetical protein SLEP1_g29123 [Rubroshorea leprosula]